MRARAGVSKARGISQVLRAEFMFCMLQLFDGNLAEGARGSARLGSDEFVELSEIGDANLFGDDFDGAVGG